MSRTIPKPTKISAPFWQGCREGVLRLQRCDACGTYVYYPVYMCPACSSLDLSWTPVSGRGRIYTRTRIEEPVSAASGSLEPLIVALVELEEGPVMMSNIVGADADDAAIGDEVTVTFQPVSAEISLPVFQLLPSPTREERQA